MKYEVKFTNQFKKDLKLAKKQKKDLDHPGLGGVPDAHVPGLPHRRRSLRLNLIRNTYMAGPFKPFNGWKNRDNLPGW